MRIGYVGHFGDHHTEWGVANALAKYAQVDRYHYKFIDQEKFTRRNYDIVLTTVPHRLPLHFWQRQQGFKVAHYFDLVVGWQGRHREYFPALAPFDVVLSTDGFDSAPYEAQGIRRVWFPQGFNPAWHYPAADYPKVRDIAFVGKAYDKKRRDLINELYRRHDFEHIGASGEIRGRLHAQAVAQTRIMVCDSARNDIPGYWSNRVYLHIACGGFVLHPRTPGLERVFTDGEHLVTYKDQRDLFNKIVKYLALDEERERIAEAGCKHAHLNHTWEARMPLFWSLLQESVCADIATPKVASACSCGNSCTTCPPTASSQSQAASKGRRSGAGGR